VQPIEEISAVCRARRVPFHVDAVQAAGKLPASCQGVDLLSLSAHKCGGPKGMGALYVRRGVALRPLLFGGPQERERRAGTENVAAIVGFAAACDVTAKRLPHTAVTEDLRERLWAALAGVPGVRRNSPRQGCVCNTLNVGFSGISADALVAALDLRAVAVSSGSACAAGASEPSHVLQALGLDDRAARDGIRFSLGFRTTAEDVDRAAAAVWQICGAAVPAADAARAEAVHELPSPSRGGFG
jgi:cysteine desulfurase